MNARPGGVFMYIYFMDENSFSNPFSKSLIRLNIIGIYTDDFSTSPGKVTILIHPYDFIDPSDIRLGHLRHAQVNEKCTIRSPSTEKPQNAINYFWILNLKNEQALP
ncbi:hypothetical protein QTP88_009778 [Uroleucon formosanum]